MSDSREARPGAPAAPRPAAAPRPPAVQPNRPVTTAVQSPRPPIVQGSRAPTPLKAPVAPAPPRPAAPPPPTPDELESRRDGAAKISSTAADEVLRAPPAEPPAAPPAAAAAPAPAGALSPILPVAVPPRVGSAADQEPYARRARSEPEFELVATPPPVPGAQVQAPAQAVLPTSGPSTSGPSSEGLPAEVQEQLYGVLRATLNASLLPLLEKLQDLEARLEWLSRADERAIAAATAAAQQTAALPAARGRAAELEAEGAAPAVPKTSLAPAISIVPKVSPSVAPTASLVPTSYGFVITPSVAPPRPAIEVALENVGPIDMPDFGRGSRRAGRVLVGLMLGCVVAAIVATILSYT